MIRFDYLLRFMLRLCYGIVTVYVTYVLRYWQNVTFLLRYDLLRNIT